MAKSKSEIQQAYMRKNYVRFPLDLRPEVLEAFRAACEKRTEQSRLPKLKNSLRSISKRQGNNPLPISLV